MFEFDSAAGLIRAIHGPHPAGMLCMSKQQSCSFVLSSTFDAQQKHPRVLSLPLLAAFTLRGFAVLTGYARRTSYAVVGPKLHDRELVLK